MDRASPLYPLGMDRVLDEFTSGRSHDLPPVDVCLGASAFDAAAIVGEDARLGRVRHFGAYGDPRGELGVRTAVAELLARCKGVEVSPSRIFITDGASGALTAAFVTLLQRGDEVIMPRVFFPPYALLAHMVGATCKFAELDGDWAMTARAVKALVTPRTRAIVINSPSNPLGTVLDKSELQGLLDLGIPLISDEVYGFLSDAPAPSLLELSSDHIAIGSFSKMYAAAGLRIGYAVIPERLIDVMFAVRASLSICTSLPSQELASILLTKHDAIVLRHRAYLADNRRFFVRQCALHRVKLVVPPKEGFFGLIDTSSLPDDSLSVALDVGRSMNLATAPGSDFASVDPKFLRLNFSGSAASIESAVSRLRAYFELRSEHGRPLAGGGTFA